MVVLELIEELKKYPMNARVLGTGYESGYEDIQEIEFTDVVVFPENPSYEGTYQLPWSESRDNGHDRITAVLLN